MATMSGEADILALALAGENVDKVRSCGICLQFLKEHCQRTKEYGYHSNIILAGRRINDDMGRYIAEHTIKCMVNSGMRVKKSTVAILGVTFKENCSDVRNSKVFDIVHELKEYSVEVVIVDPIADPNEVYRLYGFHLATLEEIEKVSAVVIAVTHKAFGRISRADFDKMYCTDSKILIDVKGIMVPIYANRF